MFWRLTTVLYVDVMPQAAVPVTVYSRVWATLDRPERVKPRRVRDENSEGFFASLTSTVIEYLESQHGVIDKVMHSQNKLTLAVLVVTWQLLRFGFYEHEQAVTVSALR